MTKKMLPMPNFLASLSPLAAFPKHQLHQYIKNAEPSLSQCVSLMDQYLQKYREDCGTYKHMAAVLWACLRVQAHRQIVQRSLSFFQSLLQSRLLLLIFDELNSFMLDQVLLFVEQPLQLVIRSSLQLGLCGLLIQMLKRNNKASSKTNQILLQLELLIIKKIRKQLDQPSEFQFVEFLKRILPPAKMELVQIHSDTIRFKFTALLRQHDESCQTFALQSKDKKLHKISQKKSNLPQWVLQAYSHRPHPLDMAHFRQKKVLSILAFLSHAQIYASSPKIDEFDEDEEFIVFFTNFLTGAQIGDNFYRFGSEGAKQAITCLRQRLAKEDECYRGAIITESMISTAKQRQR